MVCQRFHLSLCLLYFKYRSGEKRLKTSQWWGFIYIKNLRNISEASFPRLSQELEVVCVSEFVSMVDEYW